ncbi:hypothetical protein [Tropicimonas sp. S265A]|uniref:hypothetical protein n=1 Tax=Tropicimonas sp. S265A TaxID=3415134 RepID=UPI003C7C926E
MIGKQLANPACVFLTFIAAIASGPTHAQNFDTTVDHLADSREIPVTVDNLIRAATNIEFGKYVALAGGVNRFYHFREMMPVDNQTTISANRETLYGAAPEVPDGPWTFPEVQPTS